MPDTAPFRGVRFASGRVPPESGVCPPYDVIDEALHRRLLALHPHNAVRWILGARPEEPHGSADEYRRRGEEFRAWLRDGVLRLEEAPAYYGYECRYRDDGGAPRAYRALLVALAATPWSEGQVLPHERVHDHIVQDRFALVRASGIDTGVVKVVIDDRVGDFARACDEAPREFLWEGEAWDGARHRLSSIYDSAHLARLRDLLAARTAVMADGHHRYSTMIKFGEERGRPMRVLAAVGDLFQDGVRIEPTHRLLAWRAASRPLTHAWTGDFIARLRAALDDGAGDEWRVLDAQGRAAAICSRDDAARPTLARRLEQFLDAEPERPALSAFHDAAAAERALRAEAAPAVLCLMPPVGKEEFWRRATRGEIFPPKTTFFKPKIATGIVARFVDEE
ncbi:MAG: DUF1015 domain-containing protein [Planctomycetes bacterium]|nr:DUF1015 domain-containing protein [Planctomycetota bacterium]